jgi:tripartite-type tricarboxylate transporter receptor subunit TctC
MKLCGKLTVMLHAVLACAMLTAAPAAAETYPSRPITIVVPYPPGGSADLIGRMVAEKLSRSIGQTAIVENRGGASGGIGSEMVARAQPDGYTVLIAIADTHAINPAINSRLNYDPKKDFVPISLLAVQPFALAVGPSMQAASLADFIKAAKAQPGKLTYASNGAGGLQHLAMEMLSPVAGISLLHIPYKGAAPALTDVMGGHVDAIFISLQGAGSNFKSGKLRPIVITSANRLDVAPEIPTFTEAGYAAFQVQQWYGLLAPRGTPPEIIAKLNEHAAAAIKAPDVSEKLKSAGTEPRGTTPQEFTTFLDREIAQWANVVKTNNIKID